MKILYQIGSQFRDDLSDESLWLIMTKKYLEELGYSIWLSSLSDINLKEFDIIHIVNCTPVTDAYGFFKNAAAQGAKIITSPFFKDKHENYRNDPARLAAWRRENLIRRDILIGSHMLLIQSEEERKCIHDILMVDTPAKIIAPGVDSLSWRRAAQDTLDAYQELLSTGRRPESKKFFYSQSYSLPVFRKDQSSD